MAEKRKTTFFKLMNDDRGDEVEKDGVDEAEVEDDHGDELPEVGDDLDEVFEGYREL